MNEEFAIKLKTILDNSSVTGVKQRIENVTKQIQNKSTIKVKQKADTKELTKLEQIQDKVFGNAVKKINDVNESLSNATNLSDYQNAYEQVKKLYETISKTGKAPIRNYDDFIKFEEIAKEISNALHGAELASEKINFDLPKEDPWAFMKGNSDNDQNTPKNEPSPPGTDNEAENEKIGLLEKINSLWESIKQKASKVGVAAKKAASEILKFSFGLNKSGNQMDKITKNAKKFVLSLVGARSVFTGIRKAMSSYLSQNEELQNKLNACWYALGSLFAPVLEKVVSLFIVLVGWVNQLVKFLGFAGINMANYGKAAGKASKQLAGFDEINNLNQESGGAGNENPFGNFEPNIPDMSSFSKWLDDMIAKLPGFSEVLEKIGNKINDFSSNLYGMLRYVDEYGVSVKEKVIELSSGIANAFNNLVNTINWEQLGKAFGAGIDIILTAITTLIEKFDFSNLGAKIANAFNGLFAEIDFSNVGTLLVARFNIIFETINGFVKNFDWTQFKNNIVNGIKTAIEKIDLNAYTSSVSKMVSEFFNLINQAFSNISFYDIGIKIGNALSQIDWSSIFIGLVDIVFNAIDALVDTIAGLLKSGTLIKFFAGLGKAIMEGLSKCITNLLPDVAKLGVELISGLFQGILGVMSGIYQWLKDNIFTPFINGIKSLFGIHSPSTVMSEIGTNIVEGLKNGIGDVWAKTKETFTKFVSTVKTTFTNCWENIKSTTSTKWENIKSTISTKMDSIKTTLTSKWTSLKSWWSSLELPSFKIKTPHLSWSTEPAGGWVASVLSALGLPTSIPKLNIAWYDKGSNFIPYDQLAMVHQGEAVVPKKFNSDEFFNRGNEETNSLLETLIERVENLELNPYITVKDVGQASVKYINQQSRILGGSLI